MFKQIDTTRIKPRLDKIKGLQKGMQRVHKRIVKETRELVKDLDAYHRELFVTKEETTEDK